MFLIQRYDETLGVELALKCSRLTGYRFIHKSHGHLICKMLHSIDSMYDKTIMDKDSKRSQNPRNSMYHNQVKTWVIWVFDVKKTLQCKDDMDIYMGIYEA
jgi:hypothetical protein